LLYDGHGHWMLGEVRPNNVRRDKGYQMLAFYREQKDPNPVGIAKARLMILGFVSIRDYFGEPSGRIIDDYKRMCWKEENGVLDKEIRAMYDASMGDGAMKARVEMVKDRVSSESKSDHRFFFRKPVSITVPGWIKKIFNH
jgi:hypothetical protein